MPPEELDAAIIFAPIGALVPAALRAICPGGIVICGGIHMSDIPAFPYDILWREKRLVSVANLTRRGCRRISGIGAESANQGHDGVLAAKPGQYCFDKAEGRKTDWCGGTYPRSLSLSGINCVDVLYVALLKT